MRKTITKGHQATIKRMMGRGADVNTIAGATNVVPETVQYWMDIFSKAKNAKSAKKSRAKKKAEKGISAPPEKPENPDPALEGENA